MANPVLVDITKNTVTKVATNVTAGVIHRMITSAQYLQTYRLTGQAAPNEATMLSEGVLMFEKENKDEISSTAAIDVYVYCKNTDGKIRLDA